MSAAPGQKAEIYLGTQGWSYKSWVGPFLPPRTQASRYLSEYAARFSTVEIDSTYYAIPRPSVVRGWDDATPPGFRFTAKVPQVITHAKKLLDVDSELLQFIDAMSGLGPKLGPLLFQFPYQFKPDQRADLQAVLERLPTSFRYAVEVRHRGWLQDWFFQLLSDHNVGLALTDYAYMPMLERVTTDFAYIRWLGNRQDVPDNKYAAVRLDRARDLDHWSSVIARLVDQGVAVWGFANNHFMGHSPATVRDLTSRLADRGLALHT